MREIVRIARENLRYREGLLFLMVDARLKGDPGREKVERTRLAKRDRDTEFFELRDAFKR